MVGAATRQDDAELSLFASANESSYRVGEEVGYTLLLRNGSEQAVTVNARMLLNYDETFAHEVLLDVTGPDGQKRRLIPIIHASDPAKSAFRTLEPGAFYLKEFSLNHLFDLTTPGTYSILATYENHTSPEGLSPWTGTIHSNPVTITLTE